MSYDPEKAWVPVSKVRNLNRTVGRNYLPLIKALDEVLKHGYWREFIDEPTGQTHTFQTFEGFLQWAQFPSNELIAVLQAKKEDRLLARVRSELGDDGIGSGQGRPRKVSNANNKAGRPKRKPDATYWLGRLQQQRPDLAEAVASGRLSVHAAAVRAGLRKRYIQVPTDDPAGAVEKLLTEYTAAEISRELRVVA